MSFNKEAVMEIYDKSPFAFCVIKVVVDNDKAEDIIIEYGNQALACMMDFVPSNITGKSLYSLFPKFESKWKEFYKKTAFDGEKQVAYQHSKNRKKYIKIQCYQIAKGYCGCLLTDISEKMDMENQIRLYRTTSLSGVFIMSIDKDFTHLYGNDRFYAIHEYTKETMESCLHNKSIDLVYKDDQKYVREVIASVIASGGNYVEWEMRVITGKGNVRYVLCSGLLETSDDGIIMNGVVVDITPQKKTEETLRISEEKFRIAAENSAIYIWEYDIVHKRSVCQTDNGTEFGNEYVMDNFPESLIKAGTIHKDSIEDYRELHRIIDNGASNA